MAQLKSRIFSDMALDPSRIAVPSGHSIIFLTKLAGHQSRQDSWKNFVSEAVEEELWSRWMTLIFSSGREVAGFSATIRVDKQTRTYGVPFCCICVKVYMIALLLQKYLFLRLVARRMTDVPRNLRGGDIRSPISMVVEGEVAQYFIPRKQNFGRYQAVPETTGRAVAAARTVPKKSQTIRKGKCRARDRDTGGRGCPTEARPGLSI